MDVQQRIEAKDKREVDKLFARVLAGETYFEGGFIPGAFIAEGALENFARLGGGNVNPMAGKVSDFVWDGYAVHVEDCKTSAARRERCREIEAAGRKYVAYLSGNAGYDGTGFAAAVLMWLEEV